MRTCCTVCRHPDVVGLNRELLAGTSHRRVAKQFGLSPSSVLRHLSAHLAPSPEAKVAEAELPVDPRLADRVEALEGDIGVHREAILTLCGAVKRLQQER